MRIEVPPKLYIPLEKEDTNPRRSLAGTATSSSSDKDLLTLPLPYAALDGTATYRGQPVERHVDGPVDPRFRLSVNFHGAPALGLKEFRAYRQDLIVGASLQVGVPLGQYDPSRLVNHGNNRWLFKPELGASQAIGAWTLEGKFAANLSPDNKDFFGGQRRSQDNIYSLQGNVIYSFANGAWASADVTWFEGGRTTLNGVRGNDLQQNWRVEDEEGDDE